MSGKSRITHVMLFLCALAICTLFPAAGVFADVDLYLDMKNFGLSSGKEIPYNPEIYTTEQEEYGIVVSDVDWYWRDGKKIVRAEEGEMFHEGKWHVEITLTDPDEILPEDDLRMSLQGQLNEMWSYVDGIEEKTYASKTFIVPEFRGSCGEHTYYYYDWKTKQLNIGGTGPVEDYRPDEDDMTPWTDYTDILEKVVIEDGVTRIGSSAFEGCIALTQVELADTVTDIADYAFYACVKLTEFSLTEGVVNIGRGAFGYCEAVKELHIPDSVEGIAREAFSGCIGLTDITIPDNVQMILEGAFKNCKKLETASLPAAFLDDDNYDEAKVFNGCKSAVVTYRLSDENVGKIGTQFYTGQAVEPDVSVGGETFVLEKDTDYTVTYKKNVNIGTATAVVKGKGNYSGTVNRKFRITKKKLSIKNAEVTGPDDVVYSGKKQKPSFDVSLEGTALKKNTDYKVTYKNNRYVGKASVVIKGKGNYKDSLTKTFKILPKATKIRKVTGGKKKFTVKWKKQAEETSGYQIQYTDNEEFQSGIKKKWIRNPGTVSVTIKKLARRTTYYVRIRTYRKIGRKYYYSAWSKVKAVRTK